MLLCVTLAKAGVVAEVMDDGPGIPDGEREAMLKPFVRGDRARNANGFGLSIVGAIVESHGGRLTLENWAERRPPALPEPPRRPPRRLRRRRR